MSTSEREIVLPSLGESVEHGVITRWLKQVGETFAEGDALLEVATDKVDTEIPAPCDGTLLRILVDENDTAAVGAALALVVGTPPEPEPEPIVPPGPATEKLSRLRRTIAKRMVESLQVAAQLTTVLEVDLSVIARLRAAHKAEFRERTGAGLSYLPFFMKAALEALPDHRTLHCSLDADVTTVTYHERCHLGVAVDNPKGLMVPVIRDADTLSIAELARATADLAERVRSGTITADELSGGTFTVTNTGSRGALFDTPIINQPQAAILGTGAVVDRVVPVRDAHGALQIEVHPMAFLSVSYDHRIVDGADAARFLGAVKQRLESGFGSADVI